MERGQRPKALDNMLFGGIAFLLSEEKNGSRDL